MDGRRLRRGFRVLLALLTSALSLAAMGWLQADPALLSRALASAPPAHLVRPLDSPPAPAKISRPEAGVGRGAMPVGVLPPEGALVPRLTGRSLPEARRIASALGLRIRVRDRYGDHIPPRYQDVSFTVVRQRETPGTLAAPGSTLSLRAQMPAVLMGY